MKREEEKKTAKHIRHLNMLFGLLFHFSCFRCKSVTCTSDGNGGGGKERHGRSIIVGHFNGNISSFGMRWCIVPIQTIQNSNKDNTKKRRKQSMHMPIPFERTILVVREELP